MVGCILSFFLGGIVAFTIFTLCAAAGAEDGRRESEFGDDIEVVDLEDE